MGVDTALGGGQDPPFAAEFKKSRSISSKRTYNWPTFVVNCQKFSQDPSLPFKFSGSAPVEGHEIGGWGGEGERRG